MMRGLPDGVEAARILAQALKTFSETSPDRTAAMPVPVPVPADAVATPAAAAAA
jgi:hypothetical protein